MRVRPAAGNYEAAFGAMAVFQAILLHIVP